MVFLFRSYLLTLIAALCLLGCKFEPNVFATDPNVVSIVYDIPYGSQNRQKIDLYLPAGRNGNTPFLLQFHGGGWSIGDRKDNSTIAKQLLKQGVASISIGYRLVDSSQGIAAPQISEDIRAGVAYALSIRSQLSMDHGKLGLFGISAGGHLSLLYAYAYNPTHQVDQVIAYAGPSDLNAPQLLARPHMNALVKHYLDVRPGGQNGKADQWNPIAFVSAQSPATLLIHGARDTTVDPSQSFALDSALQAHKVKSRFIQMPNVGHAIDSATLQRIVHLIAQSMKE
jgi:acetyl esterase/lipase